MKSDLINNYLETLERRLRRGGFSTPETMEELEGHLQEAVEQGLRQGLKTEEAEKEALKRFGKAGRVARQFEMESKTMKKWILLVAAVLLGLTIAFVDTRATWDDTGITVFALLLGGGIIGLLLQKRPWLYALAFGIWLPLFYVVTKHDIKMLIVLIFPFIGVYAGWAVRKLGGKILHSA